MINVIRKHVLLVALFFCFCLLQANAETVRLGRGQVTVTPPEGWQIEARENLFGYEDHAITLIADNSRKPGCTIAIQAGDRIPAQTESSFLTYVKNEYAKGASQFREKNPSFRKLNIQNGIAYYVVANYAAYYNQPPAEGRAKVCGLLYAYRENKPLVVSSLYVDDPGDPALDLMVKSIIEMEINFPDYPSNNVRFDNNNSIKIDIPSGWGVMRSRGTPLAGMTTHDLEILPPSGEKAMLIITVGKPQNGTPITRDQFETRLAGRVNSFISEAVENEAEYKELQVRGGYSKYCILTDKSLVNKRRIGPDEYRYVALYSANYNNGCFLYVTVLTDDPNSASFRQMLNILASIEP